MRSAIALLLFFVVVPMPARGQQLPTLTAPVNDGAQVIDPQSAREMERHIRALQTATKDVVVVATVESLAPYASIEEFAVRLFEQAGIGTRASDNGVLIVLAVKERRARIEVGYGLEEFITDGFAGDVIRQAMLPAFRQGEYGSGLLAGTTRIIRRIATARGVTLTDVPPEARRETGDERSAIAVLIGVLIVFAIVGLIRRSGGGRGSALGRGGSTWSGWHGGVGSFGGFGGRGGFGGGGFGGGGGGGGFGGFGGGRSGGGGASGGW